MLVHQGILENVLRDIFPKHNPIKNARNGVSVVNPNTGSYLEVDVWYPDLNLGFEYQDGHHYESTWYAQIPLDIIKEKDDVKRNKLLKRGETLVLVPCWWDGTAESLQGMIKFQRPDLLPLRSTKSIDSIIPINPPSQFFSDTSPKTQLMLVSFPDTSVEKIVIEQNPWWLGEKYDGVRCFWNPEEKKLYSRRNFKIDIHPAVNKTLDIGGLDGEIWCGRGHFLESQHLISLPSENIHWGLFRVVCFDNSVLKMHAQALEKRYSEILSLFPASHPTIIIAPRLLCASSTLLTHSLQQVLEDGGEGIILIKPQSRYLPGRSVSLLKIKATRSDQEALVMDVEEDGSLVLQLANATTFVVPKENCVLPHRAVPGDIVTFTHDFVRNSIPSSQAHDATQDLVRSALTHDLAQTHEIHGVPSNAVVYRIRTDLVWDDVIGPATYSTIPTTHSTPTEAHSSSNSTTISKTDISPTSSIRHFQNEPYQKIQDNAPKPKGFWGPKNMRGFLESLMRSAGFDPLVTENWYSKTITNFGQQNKLKYMLRWYFGGSLVKALGKLFPELTFDATKFAHAPQNHWKVVSNRRALLEKFARSKGEDPLLPHFWYNVSLSDATSFKGISSIKHYYGGFAETVVHLFPELHLDSSKFFAKQTKESLDLERIEASQWGSKEKRRSTLIEFAQNRNFDAVIPDNWYNLEWSDYASSNSVRTMLSYCYNRRYVTALLDLFPELHLKPANFKAIPRGYWNDVDNRRDLFVSIAQERGFDPLLPTNWYPISYSSLSSFRGIRTVVEDYYSGSVSKCLQDVFPHIGLVQSEFQSKTKIKRAKI